MRAAELWAARSAAALGCERCCVRRVAVGSLTGLAPLCGERRFSCLFQVEPGTKTGRCESDVLAR